ncbi:IPT/TIG domain-containing protein, partial [Pedobacter terrae]
MKKILLFITVLFCLCSFKSYAQVGYKFTRAQESIVTSGDVGSYISNLNKFTVEFWARPSANSNLMFASIFVPGSSGQTELGGFGLYQNTLIVSIGSDFAGFSQSIDLGNRLSTVGWHHFAYVYNGADWLFYVDGVLISSNPDQEALSGATPNYSGSGLTQFTIGGLSDGSTVVGALDYFDGNMDDFRVWNTARTQAQLSSNRTIELTGSETGLVLYYKFNEQSGQVVSNSTALSLNGLRGVTSGTETRDPAINQLGIVTGPPITTTTAATNITGSGVTLNGTVNDNGANTTVSFDYSTNATLSSGVITANATTGGTVNAGSGNTSVSVSLSGLTGSTTYYYRVKGSNSGGSTIGNILSFTTPASTAAPVVIVPANGSFVITPTPTYGGTAPAGSAIKVYVDGTALSNTTTANSAGNWAITQPTALAQGSHTVYATAQISGNSVSANSSTNTFTVDSQRPSVVISSTAGASGGSTGTSPIPFTVTFSESVTGFVAGDITPGNATITGFSGSGTTYTFNATPTANGAVTVNVAANVAQDAAGNGNTAASQFSITYAQAVAAPTVTALSPTSGPTSGGNSVTITGTNFTGATAVTFGATAATGFTVNSATQITATAPAGTGTVDVRITTTGGTSATSASDQFTYVAAPTVTALSPTSGPTGGGTSVTITGTNFSGATAVTFGATAATGFTVNSATQITATAPAGTGTVDVRITTTGGTSATSASDQFTYVAAPTVTALSPTSGPTGGGTSVTITGTNFSGATAVTFGATAATGFTVNSATQITATAPAGTGTVDVRITTTGGISPTSASDQFTYTQAVTASPVVIVPANNGFVITPTPTYGGTAPAGSTITVYVDGTALGNTTTANSAGNWAITQPTALAQGSHTVYATAQSGGNSVSANSPTNTFTVDSQRPSLVISSTAGASGGSTGTSPIPFTVTFSESVTGFVAGDITPGNASISGFSGSGTTYTFNATPTANGAVTMNIAANVAQDAAGNGNTAASQFSITYTPVVTASPVVIVPANNGFVITPTPTYGGTAPAGSTITVYVDGTALSNTTTANSAGNWAITQPTALAQGSHTVYATAQSGGNSVSPNSTQNNFTVDSQRPSVVISSTAGASGGSTGTSPIPFTVTFSESVTGFVAGDITPGNAAITGFSGSGTTYTFNATPTANGAVTMNIAANVAQDAAGNGNTAASQFSITYVQAPVVTATGGSTAFAGSAIAIDNGLTVTDADNTTLSYATVGITGNFIAGEDMLIYLNNSSSLYGNITGSYNGGTGVLTLTSNGATATVAQWQAALRSVTYNNTAGSPNTATRTISFTVNDGTANSNTATKNVTVINQATVTSIVRAASNPTNAAAVTYTVTFNKSVTGLSTTNFSITTSGTINGISPSISGSGTTYTVTINTGTGSGTIRLNLANSTGISPSAITNLPFIGETYTIDKIAPSVTSVAVPANGTYTASQNLDFTVNFSEAVTVDATVNTPFIAVTLNTGGTVRANYISGSGTDALVYRYTVASTDRDLDGIVIGALNINGATIRDAVGNNANTTLNNVGSTTGVLVDGTPNTSQTITFNTLPAKTYGDVDFDPGATSNNSGIPITYTSSNTNVATIVNGKIHIIAVGSSIITASQAGDASHNAATDVQQTLTVNAKTITVTAAAKSKTYGDADPALTYTFAPALV